MADEACFRLLVVDSLTGNFRVDYSGRGELAERQQKLNIMLSKLKKVRAEGGRGGVPLQARPDGRCGPCAHAASQYGQARLH